MSRRKFGTIIEAARRRLGLSQAELADLVGCTANQVSRWERDIQEPSLSSAIELARALGLSVGALGGLVAAGAEMAGSWFATWQTWRAGVQTINSHGVEARHHGEFVTLQADGDYVWFGNLRVDGYSLIGDYRAVELGKPAHGALYLAVSPDRDAALGRWTGLTAEGLLGTGWGVFARSALRSRELLELLVESPAQVTEWPIELAGVMQRVGV